VRQPVPAEPKISHGLIEKIQCLNFVLVGDVRAGTFPLHTALAAVPSLAMHMHLLNVDTATRTKAYRSYFEHRGMPFDPEENSAHYFLKNRIFDRPVRGEKTIGIRITYDELRKHDLFDLLKESTNEGDFCVIHVERNPLMCYVSKKQAEKTNVYCHRTKKLKTAIPPRIWLDVEEVTDFVQEHMATRDRINQVSGDMCKINYHDLYFNFDDVLTEVLSFLELPSSRHYPTVFRLPNKTITDRVFQLNKILAELPEDVRRDIQARDLF